MVLIEDRQSADLLFLHDPEGALHVVIGQAAIDPRRHRLIDPAAVRIGARGRRADRDVSIGDDPDEPITVTHRQGTHFEVAHPLRGLPHTCPRLDGFHGAHDLRDSHGRILLVELRSNARAGVAPVARPVDGRATAAAIGNSSNCAGWL
jgi:hypothetical protein